MKTLKGLKEATQATYLESQLCRSFRKSGGDAISESTRKCMSIYAAVKQDAVLPVLWAEAQKVLGKE